MTRHEYLQDIDDLAHYHDAAMEAHDVEAVFICAECLMWLFLAHPEFRPPGKEAAELTKHFLPTHALINRYCVNGSRR